MPADVGAHEPMEVQLEQYSLLVTLSLVTLGLVIVFSLWQLLGAKRSQKRGHRSVAAVERGARFKNERPYTVHPDDPADERPKL